MDLKDRSLGFKRLVAVMYKMKKQGGLIGIERKSDELEVEDFRPIIPANIEEKLVEIVHRQVGSHQGLYKTTKRLLRHFYIAVPTAVVKEVISKCLNCARKDKNPAPNIRIHKSKANSYQASYPLE